MNRAREDLIAGLTEDLESVRAFKPRDGFAIVAVSAAISFAMTQLGEGVWMEGVTGGGIAILLGYQWIAVAIGCRSSIDCNCNGKPKRGA